MNMKDRERFLATMQYKSVDRVPYRTFGAWPETIERWKKEGFDPDNPPIATDHWEWQGGWFFPNPPFKHEVIEENEETRLYINHEGIMMRERKDNPMSSMPQFVKFPVETKEDFRIFWIERMQPDLAKRIGPNWKEKLSMYKQRNSPLMIMADRWGGFFGPLRNLLGLEKLCMLFYDDPIFIEEMMQAEADFIIQVMEQILDYTDVDVFGFWEDMAYKNGPLINPVMFRRFAFPKYRQVTDFLYSRGVKFIALDSDGNITKLIPLWLDAGINILYPFEVQSGMDVLNVRKEYGRDLRMWFGIDKRTVACGPKTIDSELLRIKPLINDGGYVPGPDHSFPPDVSFDNYCYFMKKLAAVSQI